MEGNHAVHCEALKSNPQLGACISLPASSLVVCWKEGEEEQGEIPFLYITPTPRTLRKLACRLSMYKVHVFGSWTCLFSFFCVTSILQVLASIHRKSVLSFNCPTALRKGRVNDHNWGFTFYSQAK